MADRREEGVFVMIPREIEVDAGFNGPALGIEPGGALAAEHGRGFKDVNLVLLGGG